MRLPDNLTLESDVLSGAFSFFFFFSWLCYLLSSLVLPGRGLCGQHLSQLTPLLLWAHVSECLWVSHRLWNCLPVEGAYCLGFHGVIATQLARSPYLSVYFVLCFPFSFGWFSWVRKCNFFHYDIIKNQCIHKCLWQQPK